MQKKTPDTAAHAAQLREIPDFATPESPPLTCGFQEDFSMTECGGRIRGTAPGSRPSGRFSVLHAMAKPLARGFVNVEAA
jgi:hypothetical protein